MKNGDRIIIKNVPEDYGYKSSYITEGKYEGVVCTKYTRKGDDSCYFTCLYTPYQVKGVPSTYSASGSGHTVDVDKMKLVKRDLATFWQFKEGIAKAHNGEDYQEEVNYYEIDFSDIK